MLPRLIFTFIDYSALPAGIAQLVEHRVLYCEVMGSNLQGVLEVITGTRAWSVQLRWTLRIITCKCQQRIGGASTLDLKSWAESTEVQKREAPRNGDLLT